MTADLAAASSADLACGRCGVTTDVCLSMREDCCVGCTHPIEVDDTDIDEVAVGRAMAGDLSVVLNRAEAAEAWRRLEAEGLSANQIGDRLGTTGRSVQRWRDGDASPISRPVGGRMTTAITTAPNATDSLLLRGRKSQSSKVQTATRRVEDALARLREALTEDDRNQEARERIARLERELKEAKAALRGKTAPTSPTTPRPRAVGEPSACSKCGKPCANAAGRSAHERFCDGTAA